MFGQEPMFELNLRVRDYECDLQGIVNNSVYLNYFEHTRHEYAKKVGNSFAERTQAGELYVVGKIEIEYKMPLKSGDEFLSKLSVEGMGRRKSVWYQEIYKIGMDKPATKATVSVYRV